MMIIITTVSLQSNVPPFSFFAKRNNADNLYL